MKKIKIKSLTILDAFTGYDFENNNKSFMKYEFEIKVKRLWKTYYFRMLTMSNKYVCSFLETNWTNETPKNKELRESILVEAYGELHKTLAKWKMENCLIRQEKERKEEERKKKEEEEKRKIALGEQLSFEKYMFITNKS